LIESFIYEWIDAGFILWYQDDRGERYIQLVNFEKHQTGLRKDREAASIIPTPELLRSSSGKNPVKLSISLKEDEVKEKDNAISKIEISTPTFDEKSFLANKDWEFVKSQVLRQASVGSDGYHIIKSLEFSRVEENNMIISAKDERTKLWVEERVINVMQNLAKTVKKKIVIEVRSE
jgi:hypothetical protein